MVLSTGGCDWLKHRGSTAPEPYVNKYTLGMRHWNNGGLSFLPGLMMSVFLLFYR